MLSGEIVIIPFQKWSAINRGMLSALYEED